MLPCRSSSSSSHAHSAYSCQVQCLCCWQHQQLVWSLASTAARCSTWQRKPPRGSMGAPAAAADAGGQTPPLMLDCHCCCRSSMSQDELQVARTCSAAAVLAARRRWPQLRLQCEHTKQQQHARAGVWTRKGPCIAAVPASWAESKHGLNGCAGLAPAAQAAAARATTSPATHRAATARVCMGGCAALPSTMTATGCPWLPASCAGRGCVECWQLVGEPAAGAVQQQRGRRLKCAHTRTMRVSWPLHSIIGVGVGAHQACALRGAPHAAGSYGRDSRRAAPARRNQCSAGPAALFGASASGASMHACAMRLRGLLWGAHRQHLRLRWPHLRGCLLVAVCAKPSNVVSARAAAECQAHELCMGMPKCGAGSLGNTRLTVQGTTLSSTTLGHGLQRRGSSQPTRA